MPKLGRPQSVFPGDRFGRLHVVVEVGRSSRRGRMFACLCDCGGVACVPADRLRKGDTRSCGCLRRENAVSQQPGAIEAHRRAAARRRALRVGSFVEWSAFDALWPSGFAHVEDEDEAEVAA